MTKKDFLFALSLSLHLPMQKVTLLTNGLTSHYLLLQPRTETFLHATSFIRLKDV